MYCYKSSTRTLHGYKYFVQLLEPTISSNISYNISYNSIQSSTSYITDMQSQLYTCSAGRANTGTVRYSTEQIDSSQQKNFDESKVRFQSIFKGPTRRGISFTCGCRCPLSRPGGAARSGSAGAPPTLRRLETPWTAGRLAREGPSKVCFNKITSRQSVGKEGRKKDGSTAIGGWICVGQWSSRLARSIAVQSSRLPQQRNYIRLQIYRSRALEPYHSAAVISKTRQSCRRAQFIRVHEAPERRRLQCRYSTAIIY